VLAGGSSGAVIAAAMRHGRKMKAGQVMVAILPDAGSEYISKMFNDDWMQGKGFLS